MCRLGSGKFFVLNVFDVFVLCWVGVIFVCDGLGSGG